MTMRIGIDATPLPERPVGAGAYIIHLVQALAQECQDAAARIDSAGSSPERIELVVIVQQSRRELFSVPAEAPVEWVVVSDKSPARRLVWEQTVLPWLARRCRLDLLHSLHYTRPLVLPCRSVVTFHDMTFFMFPELHVRSKRVFFPLAMRASARLADALIADSETTRLDAMCILNIPPQRITTVPLGIQELFRPVGEMPGSLEERASQVESCRQRYLLPSEFILFVGLVEPRKNLPLLVQAYARLARQGDLPDLVIVGRMGWMYETVLEQIAALGLKDRVRFTGYVPTKDLAIIYNLASVFVYPSLYEGFGFPPLEAMACGTPTITTDVSSMREFAGQACLLTPPQDEAALAAAIRRLLDEPQLQARLSGLGRIQAARYTWKRTAQETLKIYQQVLEES